MREKLYTLAANTLSGFLKTPPYIILFVSSRCPNKCTHCWYNSDWKEKNISRNELTFDELIEISRKIKRINFITYAGGEAFLREDIAEITHAFVRNSKVTRYDIPTSGFDCELITRMTEEILRINEHYPFRIDVSLDGLEETHNAIRGNSDAFANAIKTIESLKRIKERYSNFDVSIITTVSDNNNQEIDKLGNYVAQILPDGEWMVNIVRGQTPEFDISEDTARAYKRAGEIITERMKASSYIGDSGYHFGKLISAKNSLRRDLITEIINKKRAGGGCSAGALAGVIFNDGDVRPCETLELSFGNIRDYNYNLYEIWNSDEANKIREIIQNTQCICTHECFLSVNILFQPSCWFRLISKRFLKE